MALIKCPECNHDVSTEAISCPNCGYTDTFNKDCQREEAILFSPSKLPAIFLTITIFGIPVGAALIAWLYNLGNTVLLVSAIISVVVFLFGTFALYTLFDQINTIGLMLNAKNAKVKSDECSTKEN